MSQTKKQVLQDLAERLRAADANLCALADVSEANGNSIDATRLTGKVQGVRLALSYVEEALR